MVQGTQLLPRAASRSLGLAAAASEGTKVTWNDVQSPRMRRIFCKQQLKRYSVKHLTSWHLSPRNVLCQQAPSAEVVHLQKSFTTHPHPHSHPHVMRLRLKFYFTETHLPTKKRCNSCKTFYNGFGRVFFSSYLLLLAVVVYR